MVNYNCKINNSLYSISLICSILALSPWSLSEQIFFLWVEEKFSDSNYSISSSINNTLKYYLINYWERESLPELSYQLLQTLNTLTSINNKQNLDNIYNFDCFKQYLRKFRFFYQYYYLKVYPNDLSTLSFKKVNKLAITSIFILNNF